MGGHPRDKLRVPPECGLRSLYWGCCWMCPSVRAVSPRCQWGFQVHSDISHMRFLL